MNLPMIFSKVTGAMKGVLGNGALFAKKYAPELLIGSGIAGFGFTIFETVKGTNRTHDILEEKENAMERINTLREENPDCYSQENYEDDVRRINRKAKTEIIKAYLPAGTSAFGSIILVLGGYRVINGRYVATTFAYKTLEGGYKKLEGQIGKYRKGVIDRFGEEVDQELMKGLKAEEAEKEAEERKKLKEGEEEKPSKTKKKKRMRTSYKEMYSVVFDCNSSEYWQRWWTPIQVLEYLKKKERQLNDKLQIQKHLFLNEVYDALGLERTSEGAVVGWILTKANPNARVSLGIEEMDEEEIRRILASQCNDDIWVRIYPNPMGLIYQKLDGFNSRYDDEVY